MGAPGFHPLHDLWWCHKHRETHVGPIESWSMEHRLDLDPVYVLVSADRLAERERRASTSAQ